MSANGAGADLYFGINNTNYWSIFGSFNGELQFWRIISGEALAFSINAQTYVTFFGGTNAASDSRLKEQVQELPTEDCLELLRAVSAKSYVRTDLGDGVRRAGFIAQEVEAAAPASLGGNLVGETTRSTSRDDPASTETIKTLSYERLAVVLWQCTKALLARVEAQEARL